MDRDGSLVDDVRFAAKGKVAWVRNAPSPAATSWIASADSPEQHDPVVLRSAPGELPLTLSGKYDDK